jgi:hypothetical protein
MMGGVSPEIYWASYKYGIIKFWYIVASCWILFYEFYEIYKPWSIVSRVFKNRLMNTIYEITKRQY